MNSTDTSICIDTPEHTDREPETPPFALLVDAAPQVNFTYQQNDVPVLRSLTVANHTEHPSTELTLTLKSSPTFFRAKEWRLEHLGAGSELPIADRAIQLDGELLRNLTEGLNSHLEFALHDKAGQLLAELRLPVEMLAHNEWGGFGNSPQLLAAFSTPNDPSVDHVLREASRLLEAHTGDPVLQGYDKANPHRVWTQASAIWNALLQQDLAYSTPPASFEAIGQKIRASSQVLTAKMGTCLDTTMLMASAFEQVGLNPVVIIERGHAYVGLWLTNDRFALPYSEDGESVRKRVQLKELIVIETTLLARRIGFREALSQATDALLKEDTAFVGVVDISRCRDARIKPLSFTADDPHEKLARGPAGGEARPPVVLPTPKEGDVCVEEPKTTTVKPDATRLDKWQRQLLDLTLNNPLLKLKKRKANIELSAPDPGALEDLLASGKPITITAIPTHEGRDTDLYTQRTGQKLSDEESLAALDKGRVYALKAEKELDGALTQLYRETRSDLEEGGANTLFLAVGMLKWRREEKKKDICYAPLILIPVNLNRKSIRSGIKMTLHDDEPRFNTTLLEMLRQDFGLDIAGLDGALPEDESGVDIDGILTRIRREVRDAEGFEVVPRVLLGRLSFAKYLMWKDLVDRTDVLKENPVVRHLIDTPKESYSEGKAFIAPEQLDDTIDPGHIFAPLPFDSSQLNAIISAAKGADFVLNGPPGTGKSQTIANIIAMNLALGKRVLFVSEKSAALNVVYDRLQQQGLGDFCLELHSSKARKLEVIGQLDHAWSSCADKSEADWDAVAKSLKDKQVALNDYVRSLHQIHLNGATVFEALGRVVRDQQVPEVPLSWPSTDQHTAEVMEQMRDIVKRMDINASEVGDISNHPLRLVATEDWSNALQRQLVTKAGEVRQHIVRVRQALEDIEATLGITLPPVGLGNINSISSFLTGLKESYGQDLAFALEGMAQPRVDALGKAIGLLQSLRDAEGQLSARYNRGAALKIDLEQGEALQAEAETASGIMGWIRGLLSRRYLAKQGLAKGKVDTGNDLPQLGTMQKAYQELVALKQPLSQIPSYAALDSDLALLQKHHGLARRLRTGISLCAQTPEQISATRTQLLAILVDANEALASDGQYGAKIEMAIEAIKQFNGAITGLLSLTGADLEAYTDQFRSSIGDLDAALQGVTAELQKLSRWCAWRRARKEGIALGLLPLAEAMESGLVETGGALEAFEVNFFRWWVARKIDSDTVLRQFVPVEHEKHITDFSRLEEKLRGMSTAMIRGRLRSKLIPKGTAGKPTDSAFGFIRREIEKKRQHKPIRYLMAHAHEAVSQLTPCLLMSPLSVSQYLPADMPGFDLVVFDEASQISVWDAVGAIARGKQTIVAGDPKQLPPTNFFGSSGNDNDEVDDQADMESILDEMLATNIPSISLRWHYRSRHESLIAFSNHTYYGNNLVTFPSPATEDRAVHSTYVDGVYDRGGSQTNRDEAEAIVANIVERISGADSYHRTIGVVTFNQRQRDLIHDLLEQAACEEPALEAALSEDHPEPIFVKNLESVQGDERDVILFSTTFGKDKAGNRPTMNFGPLNKPGGQRRLNVAVTRAKYELHVFTSLHPEDINLTRTQAAGAKDLKDFLAFAERGHHALAAQVSHIGDYFDSPFEEAVATALQEKGWEIRAQVGVSSFRVDLGVADPDAPGSFLAGVECDGATYHRSATARDRDKVREQVLTGLDWNILRIWSTDYFRDPQGNIDKVHQSLTALLDARREARAKETQGKEEAAVPNPSQ